MAKAATKPSIFTEFLSASFYKRNQGWRTRQISGLAIALVFIIGAWVLSEGPLADLGSDVARYAIAGAIAAAGSWFGFRIVNYPPFADFLIAVEAEMAKVSWPTRTELFRATIVVLVTMVVMAVALLAFDVVWQWFFETIGFLRLKS